MIFIFSGEDGYEVIFNKKYRLSKTESMLNFEEAQERCQTESGGHLAFIESDLDYQAIKQILPINKDVWLGAKTLHSPGGIEKFVWYQDCEEIPSHYNFKLFHRNDEYSCVTFEKKPNLDIWLNERSCSDTFQYLCQKTCENEPGKLYKFRFSFLHFLQHIKPLTSASWF